MSPAGSPPRRYTAPRVEVTRFWTKPKFWDPPSVLPSWSQTLAGWYLTSGASARTPSPTGVAVTVPALCGSPPEIPKSPAPATGVFSCSWRWSMAVTAWLPALRCIASTLAGVIGPDRVPSGAAPVAAGAAVGRATSGWGTAACSDSTARAYTASRRVSPRASGPVLDWPRHAHHGALG